MTERQRKLLLIIESLAFATMTTVRQAAESCETAVYRDVSEMRDMGMVSIKPIRVETETGGYMTYQITLTPKAMGLLPRVRELVA